VLAAAELAPTFERSPPGYPDKPIKLKELSVLIMKSFNIKGSFLYALFPGPRYSYRELQYRGFLPEGSDPAMRVSGPELLEIVERVLHYRETNPDPRQAAAEAARLASEREASLAASERAEFARMEAAQRAAERQRMAWEIRAQLDTQAVADTTVRVVDEGVTISMSDIQFPGYSAELVEVERVKIMKIAVMLSAYPGWPILVGGHAALIAGEADDLPLSRARAQSVADFLVYLGCRRAEEITVEGYGAGMPVATNNTPEGRALNRRVEITLLNRE
jgi:outer membrane protein OmpA-like peptidoglycan-associated protein